MSRQILKPFLCLVPLALCSNAPETPTAPHRITQVSVIDALMVGRYDGVMPIVELLRHGDFGVGTLDHLDGELIVLEGKAYQIRGDGKVLDVAPARSTPFAVVTPFQPDGEFACPKVASLADLDARLYEALPQKNNFVAIRIDGRFSSLTMRSVHRQEPPYKTLDVVAKTQSVWTREDQVGTLVGIRCPAWTSGLNVPGYHWHFLAKDRQTGGHVLDCRVVEGNVRYDVCRDWEVKLEGSKGFNEADLVKDRSRELHKVESSRGGKSD
jgi:acetolactate decarboxylase